MTNNIHRRALKVVLCNLKWKKSPQKNNTSHIPKWSIFFLLVLFLSDEVQYTSMQLPVPLTTINTDLHACTTSLTRCLDAWFKQSSGRQVGPTEAFMQCACFRVCSCLSKLYNHETLPVNSFCWWNDMLQVLFGTEGFLHKFFRNLICTKHDFNSKRGISFDLLRSSGNN